MVPHDAVRSRSGAALAILVAAGLIQLPGMGLPLAPPPLAAQVPDTIPASVLRDAGELAARYRTGGVAFVAYCSVPPRVLGIHSTRAGAQAQAEGARARCGVLTVATPSDSGEVPMSATLARVLAETADFFATDSTVWIVAGYGFPHDIVGIYHDRGSADSAAAASTDSVGVFSFRVPLDFDAQPMLDLHCHSRSRWICPDSLPSGIPLRRSDVDSLEVRIFARDRPIIRYGFDAETDAILFSVSAVRKFFVSYYAPIYGPQWVADRMAVIEQRIREAR